jgi:Fic family protein
MARFEAAHKSDSKLKQLVSVAASHHRLAWIHPFLNGNGRVARLISRAKLKDLGIGPTLWSVSRDPSRFMELLLAPSLYTNLPAAVDGLGTFPG